MILLSIPSSSLPDMDIRQLVQHWGDGVFSVDSGYVRPRFDAIHLIVESDRAAIMRPAVMTVAK